MSRCELTLECPKCLKIFMHTPIWASPVCPHCNYARNLDQSKPKFQTVEAGLDKPHSLVLH